MTSSIRTFAERALLRNHPRVKRLLSATTLSDIAEDLVAAKFGNCQLSLVYSGLLPKRTVEEKFYGFPQPSVRRTEAGRDELDDEASRPGIAAYEVTLKGRQALWLAEALQEKGVAVENLSERATAQDVDIAAAIR